MAGKLWKKVLFLALIVACLFNVMIKIIRKTSLKSEIEMTLKNLDTNKISENNVEN